MGICRYLNKSFSLGQALVWLWTSLVILLLKRVVNAESDVAGLLIDRGENSAGIAVKSVLCTVVTDAEHYLAGDLGNINIAAGRDLAHNHNHTGGAAGFAGYTTVGVIFHYCVKYRIRDLVANFVGMSFGHRLGSE